MTTYNFKCNKCGAEIEKFRYGLDNYNKWKLGKCKIICKCGCSDVKRIYPVGSGQFKSFVWDNQ